jgi:Fur family ferric uptake transcriptional regulator
MPEATYDQAIAAFEEFLRGKGLRMTDQRRTMVRAAIEHQGHFTAEDFHDRLAGAGEHVSMATVYRGLSLLEEAAIVEGHDFADGQRRYERMLSREHHDHMVCRDCGAVIEFQNEEIERLQDQAAKARGFRIEGHVLNLYVSCDALRDTQSCERRDRQGRRRRGS